MTRQQYRNPPVHEVVLDIQFSDSLDEEELEKVVPSLREKYGEPVQRNSFEMRAGVGSSGSDISTRSQVIGWEFNEEDPHWILRTLYERLSLHFTRTATWPRGPYIGWEKILGRFEGILEIVSEAYGRLGIRRAGLRYLNRIAIPLDSNTKKWFRISFPEPAPARELFSFDLKETWAQIEGHEEYATNFRLAKIRIPDEEIAENHFGVLLDVDVFNLLVPEAPSFEELSPWFSTAHEVENLVFESCITDDLRDRFEREHSE